jgi:hypothetical protein
LLPQLIDAPEKGYEIFDAKDPDRLFSKMAVRLWNCLEHDGLFGKGCNGVPGGKQKPPPQTVASSVVDNGDQLGRVLRKSDKVPTPAVVNDNPAASQEKQGSKKKDSSLDVDDNAKPAANDDTKKKNKRSAAKSQQSDDDGAAGAPTKKRQSDAIMVLMVLLRRRGELRMQQVQRNKPQGRSESHKQAL